jgi:trans-2-enoyl-CoA reductase
MNRKKKVRYKSDQQMNSISKRNRIRWKKFAKNKDLTQEDLEQKRNLANTQERRRMLKLNQALDRLRQLVQSRYSDQNQITHQNGIYISNLETINQNPLTPSSINSSNYKAKKLSKIMTLRYAIDYINRLSFWLKNNS